MLSTTKEKITVNLPTIVKENSMVHKNSPFTFSDKDMVATIRSTSPVDVSSGANIEIVTIYNFF